MSFWDGFYFGLGLTLSSIALSLFLLGSFAIISVFIENKKQ